MEEHKGPFVLGRVTSSTGTSEVPKLPPIMQTRLMPEAESKQPHDTMITQLPMATEERVISKADLTIWASARGDGIEMSDTMAPL